MAAFDFDSGFVDYDLGVFLELSEDVCEAAVEVFVDLRCDFIILDEVF